ncbi:MAG: hypothetical protein IPI33_06070 [Dehalococcoidia bacterium]|nr:hypothetical protein [Dehalococcoidia bacterium]
MRVSLFGLAAIAFIGLAGCGGDDDSDSAPKGDLTAWKETASRTLAGEAERYGAYVDAGDAWSSAAKAKCKSGDTACEKKLPEFTSWNTAAKAWGEYVDEEFGELEDSAPNSEAEELAKEAHDALHERATKAVDIVVGGKAAEFERLESRAREAGGALMKYACPSGRNCPGF